VIAPGADPTGPLDGAGTPGPSILAEAEIRALVQRYNALGDAGRFEEFVHLFTPDVEFRVGNMDEPFVGHDGLRRMLDQAREDLLGWQPGERMHLRHFTSTHLIDWTTPETPTGTVHYQCLMPHGLDHWGRYLDSYRVHGGRWLIASRSERRDGMAEGGWAWHLWGPNGVRRT